MNHISVENHIQRQTELRRIAETERLRNITVGKKGRYAGWLARFYRALIGALPKRRFGRYNEPSSSIQTHRAPRPFPSTTES